VDFEIRERTDRQTYRDEEDRSTWHPSQNEVIIRWHRSTTQVDAAYSYRPSSVVCRSVTLVSPANTVGPIEMPFGLRTWVDPGNHVLDGGSQVFRDVAMTTNFGMQFAMALAFDGL